MFTNVVCSVAIKNASLYDAERLITDKQKIYLQKVRPRINFTEPVVILGGFEIVALRDFDTASEKISIIGSLDLQWRDDRMTWNESEYNGLQSISVESDLFWTPLFILSNSFEEFKKVGDKPYWPVIYTSDGSAMFFPGDIFTCTCTTDVTYYPWDSQSCILVFVAYGLTSAEIQVSPRQATVEMNFFNGNGEWDITDSAIGTKYDNIALTVRLNMQRKPTFIVLNYILPIIFLSFMGSFSFCIPTESGERISYGMTVLLAMSVFLTIVSQTLPSAAENIAVLCYYIVAVIALNIVIVLGIILNMNIHFRDENRVVSTAWVRILHFFTCRNHRETVNDQGQITLADKEFRKSEERYFLGVNLLDYNGEIVSNKQSNNERNNPAVKVIAEDEAGYIKGLSNKEESMQNRGNENKRSNCKALKWKDVSWFLDIVFLFVSLLGTVVLTSLFFGFVLLQP